LIDIKTVSIRIEEGNLTGESQAVLKSTETQKVVKVIPAERHNIAFSSTLVSNGKAVGVVIGTGMDTEIGGIQKDLEETEKEDSPLQKRLDQFGETLAKAISVICVLVWLINFRNFNDEVHGGWVMGALYYFKIAVALAVAAIPEGLPAVITTCLALGSRRMARERAIVRKLPSVETLGCTTVICSDKTGTLTTNEMVVREFFYFGDSANNFISSDVKGDSYQPVGAVSGINKGDISSFRNLRLLAQCMSLNNDAKLVLKDGKTARSGLPTEAALKVLVEKFRQYDDSAKVSQGDAEAYGNFLTANYKKLATLEFTRERKSMSVIVQDTASRSNAMFIKGAPDYLIKASTKVVLKNGEVRAINENEKKNILEQVNRMAKKGLRTLAICYKDNLGPLAQYDGPHHPSHKLLLEIEKYGDLEREPVLIGFVGIQDPARSEVIFFYL
jgi:P-type Ca2+ transporter type 2C